MPIQIEPPMKRIRRPRMIAETGPKSIDLSPPLNLITLSIFIGRVRPSLPVCADPSVSSRRMATALRNSARNWRVISRAPKGMKNCGNGQVGLGYVHRPRLIDDGIPEKYEGKPGEGHAEDKADDIADHVEDNPVASLDEMGKHHNPDMTALPQRIGKAAKGQHCHEIA